MSIVILLIAAGIFYLFSFDLSKYWVSTHYSLNLNSYLQVIFVLFKRQFTYIPVVSKFYIFYNIIS